VASVRAREVRGLRVVAVIKSLNQGISLIGPALVCFVTFSIFVALGGTLTAATAFTTLGLYNAVRFPLSMLPLSIKGLAETIVAFKRLKMYLNQPELVDKRKVNLTPKRISLKVDASFTWPARVEGTNFIPITKKEKKEPKKINPTIENGKSEQGPITENPKEPTLRNVKFDLKAGELLAVVGAVGSGKSSLLYGILGQMEMISGYVEVNGSTAFVSQQAWLLNDTVRNNILFGEKYDKMKYRRVIEACQLLPDFDQFPARDQTEIGERGVSLSGGQKQRVAIARAVYANKDIYIFDDPLSAVDQHVGNVLFNKLIRGLLREKAIVLATNQIQYLPQCDKILLLKNGTMAGYGTYDQLMASNVDFRKLVTEHIDTTAKEKEAKERQSDTVPPRSKSPLSSSKDTYRYFVVTSLCLK